MSTTAHENHGSESLAGRRVAFVGRLAGMSRREAGKLIRSRGGVAVDAPRPDTDWIVVGDGELPLVDLDALLDDATRRAVADGALEVMGETRLWHELGFIEDPSHVHRLHTPAMLAELLGVPLAVVRRWHRRGLIVPAREVRRLPYFDYQEVAHARRLAELLAAGVSPRSLEQKLAAWARWLPGVERPLAQLSVIVEGKELLLRQGEGLVDSAGQRRFDFDAPADHGEHEFDRNVPGGAGGDGVAYDGMAHADGARIDDTDAINPSIIDEACRQRTGLAPPPGIDEWSAATPRELCQLAERYEDDGQLDAATDLYRAALAAGGPDAELCFRLAELLYRQGDLSAARERYYMTIELDEDYVEARANLGCVLAEAGDRQLAVAAFEGALRYHDGYPDAHYHLAHVLDALGRPQDAAEHWRAFLELAPDNPWADIARERMDRLDSR